MPSCIHGSIYVFKAYARARVAAWRVWEKKKRESRYQLSRREQPFNRAMRPASDLQRLNVRGLQALRAADNFELDRLAVVQALVAIREDRGEVDENVLSGLALDETKALAGVKPLHCSLFFAHFIYSFRR